MVIVESMLDDSAHVTAEIRDEPGSMQSLWGRLEIPVHIER